MMHELDLSSSLTDPKQGLTGIANLKKTPHTQLSGAILTEQRSAGKKRRVLVEHAESSSSLASIIPGRGAADLASSDYNLKSKQESLAGTNVQYLSVPTQKRASGVSSSKNNHGRPGENHHEERGLLSSAKHQGSQKWLDGQPNKQRASEQPVKGMSNSGSAFSNSAQELLNCQKKSTMNKWEALGRWPQNHGGNVLKSYDKMIKSYIVSLTERDTHIRYPRNSIPFLNQVQSFQEANVQNSTDFDRSESPRPPLLHQIRRDSSSPSGGQTEINSLIVPHHDPQKSCGVDQLLESSQQSFVLQQHRQSGIGAQSQSILSHALLLQIMIPENESFSLEFNVLDLNKTSRCLIIGSCEDSDQSSTTITNEVYVTNTHARIPNMFIERRIWLNLVIDLRNLYNCIYRGSTYRSLEGMTISAVCKIRRVMTLSSSQMQLLKLIGTQTAQGENLSINTILPQSTLYPSGVTTHFQLFNYESGIASLKYPFRWDLKHDATGGSFVPPGASTHHGALQHYAASLDSAEGNNAVQFLRKRQGKANRLSPMPLGVSNQNTYAMSRQNFTGASMGSTISPRQMAGSSIGNAQKMKQSSQKAFEKARQQSINKEQTNAAQNGPTGFTSTKSHGGSENLSSTFKHNGKGVSNQRTHVNQYSEANTTFSTRKKSIPSANSHTFVSTEENFQIYSQHKGSSIGAGGTQTINNLSNQGDLQSTLRASAQRMSNDRAIGGQASRGGIKDQQQQQYMIGLSNGKVMRGKKVHPLSAVQKTNKLSNNLYSVVNNKLVRNVQGQQHNTNSGSQSNIDRLLFDYDSQSNAKISPSPSEERLYEIVTGLSKTFMKHNANAADGQNQSFSENGVTPNSDQQSFNFEAHSHENPIFKGGSYLQMKQQANKPKGFPSDSSPGLSHQTFLRDANNMSSTSQQQETNDGFQTFKSGQKRHRFPKQPAIVHEYSTGSLPQIDEVSSPQPTTQVSRLAGNQGHPKSPIVDPSLFVPQEESLPTFGSAYSYNGGQQQQKFSNIIFPGGNTKLATAIAWHEESIREENEYAENDEVNQSMTNNPSGNATSTIGGGVGMMTGQKSSESLMRERRKGQPGAGNGVRNNKMRTSQENPLNMYTMKIGGNGIGAQILKNTAEINKYQATPYINSNHLASKAPSRAVAGKFSTIENTNIQIISNGSAIAPQQTINYPGVAHLNRNLITNSNPGTALSALGQQSTHQPQLKIQQRYASQIKEKAYVTNSSQPQDGSSAQLNEKLQVLQNRRHQIQEIQSKYANLEGAARDMNRGANNKSEMLPQGSNVIAHLEEPSSKAVAVKAKSRVTRAQEANKILKAYNALGENEGMQAAPGQRNQIDDFSPHETRQFGRPHGMRQTQTNQHSISVNNTKKRDLSNSGIDTINLYKGNAKDQSDQSMINSQRAKNRGGLAKVGKGSLNASKVLINPTANNQTATPQMMISNTKSDNEQVIDVATSIEMVATKGTSQRAKQAKQRGKAFGYPSNEDHKTIYGVNHQDQRKPQGTRGESVASTKHNTKTSGFQQPKVISSKQALKAQEQQKLLQKLNHDYNFAYQNKDDEDISSMIEEQIDRESERRSEVDTRGGGESRKARRSRGTANSKYRKQKTGGGVTSGIEAGDQDDDYDADYDNLVVSDILGISGAPILPSFGTFGVQQQQPQQNGQQLKPAFSLYDFS